MARTAVFFSTKGGVGKTSIALNVAISLSLKKHKVLLLGLDLEAPLDAAKMSNAKVRRAMVDLLPVWEKIKKDPQALRQTFFTAINPYLDFIPAVVSLKTISHLDVKAVRNILGLFRGLDYEFIIIDGGNNLSDILIETFDNANVIFLVVTPDILSLYQTEWVMDTLQTMGFPLAMVKIILNRSDSTGSVSPSEIKMILPVDIFCKIPSDGKVAGLALNRGVPFVLDSPNSRMSIAIDDLSTSLIENESVYISHKQLSELRVKKEDDEKQHKIRDVWSSLGLVEPLKEVEIERSKDIIIAFKRKVHRRLIDEMNLKKLPVEIITMDAEQTKKLKEEAEKIVANIIADAAEGFLSSYEVRKKFIDEIIDEALGFGPLEDLIKDPRITEIMVNNKDQIYIEKNGKLEITSKRFTSDDHVRIVIERILTPLGRRIDESSPYVDARLPDGSRVNAIIPPLSLTGPTLTIRKFAKQRLTVKDLIERFNSLNEDMSKFIEASVKARKNILVSGGTGSGKTTLLNILSEFIPDGERIITIEDSAELKLHHQHWIRLESRPPNIEGRGEITIRDLFRNTLRMRPDRIIVGECRGKEVLDMLQAMNTGHDGSMSTIHANSPHDVLIRLDSMILMSGVELPIRAIREMISSAINLIIHTSRLSDGSRRVVGITEVVGMLDETKVDLHDIFVFKQTGITEDNRIKGYYTPTGYIPTYYNDMKIRGLDISESMFSPHD